MKGTIREFIINLATVVALCSMLISMLFIAYGFNL